MLSLLTTPCWGPWKSSGTFLTGFGSLHTRSKFAQRTLCLILKSFEVYETVHTDSKVKKCSWLSRIFFSLVKNLKLDLWLSRMMLDSQWCRKKKKKSNTLFLNKRQASWQSNSFKFFGRHSKVLMEFHWVPFELLAHCFEVKVAFNSFIYFSSHGLESSALLYYCKMKLLGQNNKINNNNQNNQNHNSGIDALLLHPGMYRKDSLANLFAYLCRLVLG